MKQNDTTTTLPEPLRGNLPTQQDGKIECVGACPAKCGKVPGSSCRPAPDADSGNAPVTRQELILPWPPKDLSPNARVHWSKKSKAAKAYKHACWALTKEAKLVLPDSDKLALWLDFVPPDRRGRDDDNMVASFKSGRDGLALALGIDDKRFRVFPYVSDEIGGFVRVRITDMPEIP